MTFFELRLVNENSFIKNSKVENSLSFQQKEDWKLSIRIDLLFSSLTFNL